MRGILTEEAKKKYRITQKELRLLPYLQYLIMNHAPIDHAKIDSKEREILQKWKEEGKIEYSCTSPCACTKEFWDWMHDVLWYGGYAIHLGEEQK